MLRTALGPAITKYLDDAQVVEVMFNPDGRLAQLVVWPIVLLAASVHPALQSRNSMNRVAYR